MAQFINNISVYDVGRVRSSDTYTEFASCPGIFMSRSHIKTHDYQQMENVYQQSTVMISQSEHIGKLYANVSIFWSYISWCMSTWKGFLVVKLHDRFLSRMASLRFPLSRIKMEHSYFRSTYESTMSYINPGRTEYVNMGSTSFIYGFVHSFRP